MNTSLKFAFALAAAIVIGGAVCALPGGGGFDLTWHTIGGGGGESSAGGYALNGTIGQPSAGEMSGGGYALVGGFWAVESQPALPCAGDIDGDQIVSVQDLLQVILGWGVCPPGPCAADTNGDGFVEVQDLVTILVAWGPCA